VVGIDGVDHRQLVRIEHADLGAEVLQKTFHLPGEPPAVRLRAQ